jgi:hypothetical protein
MSSAAVIVLVITIAVAAQAPPAASTQGQPGAPQPVASRGCLAVTDAGSHAFRNIMLGGLAGALVSKKQYRVADAVDYPAKIGQKFHGNDLQTLQQGGTRIVILDKKYSADELHKACR